MPIKSDAELGQIISDGNLGAISLDTSIYHRHSFGLEAATLLALNQFVGSPVSFLVPDIIRGEVKGKMAEIASEGVASLRKALRQYEKARPAAAQAAGKAAADAGLDDDVVAEADKRWQEYVDATSANILTAGELIDPDRLVELYLSKHPPFENKKDKKAEFPDAIALLELEAWGEHERKYVLALSLDEGWRIFAQESERIIVRDDLPKALSLFHQADQHVVSRVVGMINDPERFRLAEALHSEASRFVDNLNPDIQATSYLFYEVDFLGASYLGYVPVEDEQLTIIDAGKETVTVSFPLGIRAEIEADFGFSIRDSFDGDYVGLGAASETRTVVLNAKVVMEVSRELSPDDDPTHIEIEAPRFVPVEFGEVQPDMKPDPEDWL